jgi:hypothetical protein
MLERLNLMIINFILLDINKLIYLSIEMNKVMKIQI